MLNRFDNILVKNLKAILQYKKIVGVSVVKEGRFNRKKCVTFK
ncbi:MAG: hypothetical protein NZO16_01925 [Deltaproteobacteria bacterium]|nr:hypothetical protein [Deltaproteobacteria bacterium]